MTDCCLAPVTPIPAQVMLAGMAAPSRLLLIEADEAVATALCRGLGRHGWTVLTAPTAKAGLQLQAEWTPHVVVLASDLPDMAVGRLVVRLAKQVGCVIFVLSGYEDDHLRRMVLEQGAHEVMSKPMRAKGLAGRLRTAQCRLGQTAAAPEPLR